MAEHIGIQAPDKYKVCNQIPGLEQTDLRILVFSPHILLKKRYLNEFKVCVCCGEQGLY